MAYKCIVFSEMDCSGCPNSPLIAPQNFKVTMEMDELQRRITELCDINADLQVPFTVSPVSFLVLALQFYILSLPVFTTFTQCISLVRFSQPPPWHSNASSISLPSSKDGLPVLNAVSGKVLVAIQPLYCTFFILLCNYPFPVNRCRFTLLMLSLVKKMQWYKRSVPYAV